MTRNTLLLSFITDVIPIVMDCLYNWNAGNSRRQLADRCTV